MLALIIIILLVLLLFLGMPIGFTLIIAGSVGIYLADGIDTLSSILSTTVYSSVNGFTFTAIPLFILMAHFISKSRIAEDLYDSIIKWIGHLPGGVGVSTVLASAGFGALSGSSVAATAIMSKITIPEMIKAGYKESFSAGLVATVTGTLAVMIPPSVPLIIYGVQTENSIGKLLIAGVFPGILLALLISTYIIFVSSKMNIKTEKYSWTSRWHSLRNVWSIGLVVLFVVTVIYFGWVTSTEAAAFGAFGALIVGLFIKRLNFKSIIDALIETTQQTAMIFIIILGGHIFAYFITLTGVGQDIINTISEAGLSKWTVLFLIILTYIIIGCFIDAIGSLLLTLPLVYPIIIGLGFDPIWFGVVVVLLLEVGLVTPPVGINLFITSNYSKIPVQKIFYGSIPFLLILLLTVLILVIFPQIALYLPANM